MLALLAQDCGGRSDLDSLRLSLSVCRLHGPLLMTEHTPSHHRVARVAAVCAVLPLHSFPFFNGQFLGHITRDFSEPVDESRFLEAQFVSLCVEKMEEVDWGDFAQFERTPVDELLTQLGTASDAAKDKPQTLPEEAASGPAPPAPPDAVASAAEPDAESSSWLDELTGRASSESPCVILDARGRLDVSRLRQLDVRDLLGNGVVVERMIIGRELLGPS